MSKFTYDEDVYEAVNRMMITKGNEVISSIKEGDYINMLDEACEELDENWDEYIDISFIKIDNSSILNPSQNESVRYKRNKEGREKFKELEIRRIFKVTRIEKGVPIIMPIAYPNEKLANLKEISLVTSLCEFAQSIRDVCVDDDIRIKTLEDSFSKFVTLDKDYVDMILLDGEYVPYLSSITPLKDYIDSLYDEARERRREKAREAAKLRNIRKLDDNYINQLFAKHLKQLEKTDLKFAAAKRKFSSKR